MAENEVPQNVIEALADVREWGRYNMFQRDDVIRATGMFDEDAYNWLIENKDRYMDALNAMGQYISNQQ